MYKIKLENPILEFTKIFDEFFDESYDITSRKCPAHDVIENDKIFIIEIELASIKKENININTEDNTLIIEAERKIDKTLKYNRQERYVGKFKRIFTLPDNVDTEGIKAKLDNGILTISIPKTIDETKKKKQIVIK